MSIQYFTRGARLAGLLLPFALTAPSWAQEGPASATLTEASATVQDDGTSVFGEPLYVNGKRISDLAIKRYLCYGKGRNGLESLRLGLLMDQERELRQIKATERLLDETYGGKALEELSEAQQAELKAALDAEMSRFVLDNEEFQIRLKKDTDSFAERYPTLDLKTEIERAYQDMDWWQDQIRMTLEFDQLFFPGHPDGWPDISLEASRQASPQFDLIAEYTKYFDLRKIDWEERRAAAQERALAEYFDGAAVETLDADQAARLKTMVDDEAGKFMPRDDDMMMAIFRDAVQMILNDQVTIKTASDGLPENILMSIEGNGLTHNLTTEQVYQDMKNAFSDHDIYEAKLFLAMQQATHDRLEKEGKLVPEAPFRAEMAQKKIDGAKMGTFGSMSFVAVNAYGFPSVESFEDYSYLLESYRQDMLPGLEMTAEGDLPPALAEHFPIVQGIMGIAKVQSELLLVSAFDIPANQWKEDGWSKAYDRAMTLRAEVDNYLERLNDEATARAEAENSGKPYEPAAELQPFDVWWARFLDLNSDYWDPPMPVTGKAPPANSLKDKGRFDGVPTTRNDLKGRMGESPYTHYLWNANAVDQVFFDVPEGSVGGPFRGPQGYFIAYVKRKVPPTKSVSLREDRIMEALREDYIQVSFIEYSHGALEQAEIKGL